MSITWGVGSREDKQILDVPVKLKLTIYALRKGTTMFCAYVENHGFAFHMFHKERHTFFV